MRDPGFLKRFHDEARQESRRILRWWQTHMPDATDGFWGEVDSQGLPVPDAPRSIVLYTRLLWFFSAMASHLDSDEALQLAHRAFRYIRDHFLDSRKGGLFWLLDARGQIIDAKKQVYAQAFGIYALAEYFHASGDEDALNLARELQCEIEDRFWDDDNAGYIEAIGGDQRLSEKDLDAPKTMNTHLHVLEAYARLHRVAPDLASREGLERVLGVFMDHFVDPADHLRLFFDMEWNDLTQAVSYGHDIEASWLLWEAAEALGDETFKARALPFTLGLARATLHEGLNVHGGISYERRIGEDTDTAGEWWGQAEGLVGFINAWELSGDAAYLDALEGLWAYAKAQYGAGGDDEWTWYAADAGRPAQVKAGQWKCPYHNGRAMIELDQRLTRLSLRKTL